MKSWHPDQFSDSIQASVPLLDRFRLSELEKLLQTSVYQVLFTPLRAPWAENALAAVTKEKGKPFFDDGAELVKQAQAKVSRPLYGAVLRLAAKSAADSGLRRTWEILRGLAPALRLFSREGGQSLMPLAEHGLCQ